MRNIGLGDRMKQYEQVTQVRLIRRMPVILRLDGKSFHRFTRGFEKPFDPVMLTAMQNTMQELCNCVEGCVLGYTQSDEISLVLCDYQQLDTEAWFGNKLQKLCRISASICTSAFQKYFREAEKQVDWETFPTVWKRGTCCIKMPQLLNQGTPSEIVREKWCLDLEIPVFSEDCTYVEKRIHFEDAEAEEDI